MKYTITIVAVVILAFAFLFWGKGNSSNVPSTSTGVTMMNLMDPAPKYDFGSISMLKGNVSRDFAIKNNTNEDLLIESAETSCMCTRTILTLPDGKQMGPFGMPGHGFTPKVNAVVRPGETVTVQAIFDPAAHGPAGVGLIERVVTLDTNKGPITMQFRATVTP